MPLESQPDPRPALPSEAASPRRLTDRKRADILRAAIEEFRSHGFEVVVDEPLGLFYTGYLVLGERLPVEARAKLAKVLGSACQLFELRVR